MMFLKRLLTFIVILVVLLFIISFFLPGKAHVERSLQMSGVKPAAVYAQLINLKTYNNWMPWNKKDSNMKQTMGGITSGVGASYSWESKKMGNGSLNITEAIPNKVVRTDLNFMENGTAKGGWEIEEKDGGSNVKWFMDSEVAGGFFTKAISKYFFLFMDKMVGPDFEEGLASLKQAAEKTPALPNMPEPKMEIAETNVKAMNLLYIKTSADNFDQVGQRLGAVYGQMSAFIKELGLKVNGAPMAFYSAPDYPVQIEAAIAVDKLPPATQGSINTRQSQETQAVVVHYYGPYQLLSKAYDKINAWMKVNNKESNGAPYEVYIGDPGVEKDPYKVQTDIIQPIK